MPRDKKRKLPHRRSKNPPKPPRRKRTRSKNPPKPPRRKRTRSKKRPISRRTPRTQARTRKIHRRKPTQVRTRKKRPTAVRVRTRKKRPTAVRVRRVESRTIRIPQDTERRKNRTQFARQQLQYKFSGRPIRNTEFGLSRLSKLYSKIRTNRRTGATFQETLWLRVKYKGQRGKYKIRTVPVTGKNFRVVLQNIRSLNDGFTYEQYNPDGSFKKEHARDTFTIVGMKYERIALLKAVKKKK